MKRTLPTVPAHCTLEKLATRIGGGGGWWKVSVWSPVLRFTPREYTIEADDDNLAAREGLRRFEEEHTQPPLLVLR